MDASTQLSARISEALARGDALGALRLMRQAGTHGLKDALVAAQQQAKVQTQAGAGQAQDGSVGNQVRAALQSGDPIEAMRRLRAANPGMSLRDAKLAVEALQQRQRAPDASGAAANALLVRARNERTPTVQEGDHGGYAVVLLAVVSAVAALAWWWLGG